MMKSLLDFIPHIIGDGWEESVKSSNDPKHEALVVTHDPKVAQQANRVIVLADGQIVKRFKGKELSVGSMPFFKSS